jgi:hypothetical protein
MAAPVPSSIPQPADLEVMTVPTFLLDRARPDRR